MYEFYHFGLLCTVSLIFPTKNVFLGGRISNTLKRFPTQKAALFKALRALKEMIPSRLDFLFLKSILTKNKLSGTKVLNKITILQNSDKNFYMYVQLQSK